MPKKADPQKIAALAATMQQAEKQDRLQKKQPAPELKYRSAQQQSPAIARQGTI
jgi:hypothetical protein